MPNEIGDAFTEAMPAVGTPGPTYATEIEEVVAEIQDRLDKPVPLTSLASQADNTVLARVGAGSTGAPSAVTLATFAAALPTFAVGVTGMVTGPATGPTGTRFLRDDNTWQPATVDLSGYLTTAAAAATYASYAYIAGQSYATIGDLANLVPNTLTITAGTGLVGGGDLTANRTLSLADQASGTVMANTTGGSAAPVGVTYASLVGVLPLASGGSRGMLPALSGVATQVLAGDGSWTTLPTFNGTVTGLVPVGDGASTKYLSADGTFTVPAGGGGGFPKTDVPLNVRTEFDGSNYVTIRPTASDSYGDAATERLALQVTNHELRLFDPAATDQKVRVIALDRARHRFYAWYAGATTSFIADAGTPTAASGGAVTSSLPVSGTDFTVENDAVVYLRAYATASSAQVAGFWTSTPLVSAPNAGKTTGGFLLRVRFSPRFSTVHTTSRVFVGVSATDPRGANQDFGALLNHAGVCLDQGDTNLCLSFRGPSGGTRQKIDLGSYFVGNYATAATKRYAFSFYFPRNLPNKCFVTAENLTDRVTAHHVVTLTTGQDYPDPAKGLNMTAYVNNGTGYPTSPGIGLETYQLIHGV